LHRFEEEDGMEDSTQLRVIKHAENGARNIEVIVHGPVMFEDGANEAEATVYSNPEFVRFSFDGPEGDAAGARVRIEIRKDSQIVYREEAQIEVSGAPYRGPARYFKY
jgi:hypothetical protein